MLHIILGILKIIGVLLLVILLLILLLLSFLLFAPVRYGMSGEFYEEVRGEVRVTWLFRIFSVSATFLGKNVKYSMKIFGFPLGRKKIQAPKAVSTKTATNVKKKATEKPAAESKAKTTVKPAAESKTKTIGKPVAGSKSKTTVKPVAEMSKKAASAPAAKEKKTVDFKKKLQNIQETIDHLKKQIERIQHFLQTECTQKTIAHVKKEILSLFLHFRPRKLEGVIRFGLEDPGSTGQMLGYLSILQGLTGNHLRAEGVFDKKTLEGTFFLKGHIRLCHAVKTLLGLLLDRNVRITVKRLLKMRGK